MLVFKKKMKNIHFCAQELEIALKNLKKYLS